jgi:hypothetical protein
MKKTYLLLSLMFVAFCANAQFFQHLYGTSGSEYGGNGLNTNTTGMGHFVVSPSQNSSIGDLLAVNTDVNGNPGAFNNIYSLIHNSGVSVTPRNTLPLEFSSGSGYGVFGLFYDPSSSVQSGIYYLELDVNGNVLNTTQYDPVNTSSTNFYVVEVGDVSESSSGDIYITGTVDPQLSTGSFWMFAMKINQAGNVLWSTIYDINNPGFSSSRDWAKGIIESPYTPISVPEVVVVGHTYGNGGSSDAFFMRLNANTGTLLASPYIYGTTTDFDQFTCIKVANSTTSGTNGFIVGGNSDAAGSNTDFWLTKLDPVGNSVWSNLYDYNGSSGNYDNCTDVIERLNTSGAYEYFVSGVTNTGNVGGNTDLVVIKTDDTGNPYFNGQFTYGSNIDDGGAYLDQYNGTGADGLSVFGTFGNGTIGNSDAYLVKAYFNGLSGCNEDFANTSPTTGPTLTGKRTTKLISTITDATMGATFTTAVDATLCYSPSITGGSNARTIQKDNNTGIVASPNPLDATSNIVTVSLESETNTQATIALYDMLGRTYYNQTTTLTKGKNSLPIDISNANLAPGMYTLRISSSATNNTILLLVK